MFQPEKIEEWILEVRERPSSAPLVIQYIANRLQDLTEWNEKLRTDNLELRSGHRVAEYERQIVHLEYQLELLKRQVDGTIDLDQLADISPKLEPEFLNLLVYGPGGQVSRIEMDPAHFEGGTLICSFEGIQEIGVEPPAHYDDFPHRGVDVNIYIWPNCYNARHRNSPLTKTWKLQSTGKMPTSPKNLTLGKL